MTENESEEVKEPEQDEPEKVEKTEEEKREDRLALVRFFVLSAMVLIPLVVGFGCLIGGANSSNHTVAFAGKLILCAGVPGMMIIGIAAGLIWKFHGVRKNEEEPRTREREQNALAAVNGTHGGASRAALGNYEADHIAEGMKHAPKWGLPVGLVCFFSLVALLVAATVLLIKRIFVGAIVCAAIVGVVLIATFIVMAVSRAKATNGDISKAKKITTGKVKACFMVGMAETRTRWRRNSNAETVRVHGVTYRVIVIAEDKEYRAFSKKFYETSEEVTVAIMSKTRAKIVEEANEEKTE